MKKLYLALVSLAVLLPFVLLLTGCNDRCDNVECAPQYVSVTPPQSIAEPLPYVAPNDAVTKRSVHFGLNRYPSAPLSGCVNDARDMDQVAAEYGFNDRLIICDDDATKAMMITAIRAALDVKPPAIVFITYSGHGAKWTGPGSEDEADRTTEILCPIDFAWTPETMITDDELNALFSSVKPGVSVWFLSDSCNSGDLIRDVPAGANAKQGKIRSYPNVPAEIRARNKAGRQSISRAKTSELLIGYGSGCKSDELSTDTSDENGRPCGAFTMMFKKALATGRNKYFKTVISDTTKLLRQSGYDQTPQAEGLRINAPFLSLEMPRARKRAEVVTPAQLPSPARR